MSNELQCFHKGCGKKYFPHENKADSCEYHPGYPVFHDALKGWSCCKKRSTDFTEFLNIPGCTKGQHSNEKPAEPEKPKQEESNGVAETPPKKEIRKPTAPPMKRPAATEDMIRLPISTVPSLDKALAKKIEELQLTSEEKGDGAAVVTVGTSCKNSGCQKTYEGEHSNSEDCEYHPGVPVFHEGMKYWSCCQRKTSDFDNFLSQVGCTQSKHVWFKKKSEVTDCRLDYHQTAKNVVVSVFSKVPVPKDSYVEANRVSLKIYITFEGGKSIYKKELLLQRVVDLEGSSVKMMGTKVEITLKKAEPGSWSDLILRPTASVEADATAEDNLDTIEANEPPRPPEGMQLPGLPQ